jgi:hypothetical protein
VQQQVHAAQSLHRTEALVDIAQFDDWRLS